MMGRFFILITFILSSCLGIVNDDQVEKDTLKQLKEKYNEDFSVLSVSNDTKGHGKGAVIATGNIFTVELNSQSQSPIAFQAYVGYDSNQQFIFYGDTYHERAVGDQMKDDLSKILREGYPDNIVSNLYFDNSEASGSLYFFKKYPASEKEMTEYLRKYLVKLREHKVNSVDLFVYYWDESFLKDDPIDSFRFAFAYEYHEGYFETGKSPDRRYRLQLEKEKLDQVETLDLYGEMKDL